MRLCFDMDGTLTEGRFLEPPRTFEMYMSLSPYDGDTHVEYNRLALKHEIYILTARSDKRADMMIKAWLDREAMLLPTSIITGISQPSKWFMARMMNCDLLIDDSPHVAETAYNVTPQLILMDNPYWQKNQKYQPYPYVTRCSSWKDLGVLIETIDIKKSYESLTTP